MPETHDQLVKRIGRPFVQCAVQLFRGKLIPIPRPKRQVMSSEELAKRDSQNDRR